MRTVIIGALVVAVVGTAIFASAAVPASAAGGTHTQSFTDNFHGAQTATDFNPCTGNTVDISSVDNIVMHVTFFPASDESWATFTDSSKFQATDEGTGTVYSGHATFWGNNNVNRQSANFTFTSTIVAKGSDGTTINFHEVGHATMLPDGNIAVSFDKSMLTCGS